MKKISAIFVKRTWFIALLSLLLAAPMARHLIGTPNTTSLDENRLLATPPELPRTVTAAMKFPVAADAYLNDHFGFRSMLVKWNNKIRFYLLHETSSSQITLGSDGYIFLNSHAADQPRFMIDFLCGKDVTQPIRDDLAMQVAAFMDRAKRINPNSFVVFVPTKPVLYPEKLPHWMREQCAQYAATLPSIIGQLHQRSGVQSNVIYPIADMMELKQRMPVYPKENFHWDGNGPRPVAEYIADRYFQLPQLTNLTMRDESRPSDLQRFMPGIALTSNASMPAYQESGVKSCAGGICFPEFRAIADKLGDVSRFQQTIKKGPKLLLISDSFGAGIAGYFSESFGEVWHLSVNNLNGLSPAEVQTLRDESYTKYHPDFVLYLFHDFSIACFSSGKKYCPVNPASILPPDLRGVVQTATTVTNKTAPSIR